MRNGPWLRINALKPCVYSNPSSNPAVRPACYTVECAGSLEPFYALESFVHPRFKDATRTAPRTWSHTDVVYCELGLRFASPFRYTIISGDTKSSTLLLVCPPRVWRAFFPSRIHCMQRAIPRFSTESLGVRNVYNLSMRVLSLRSLVTTRGGCALSDARSLSELGLVTSGIAVSVSLTDVLR